MRKFLVTIILLVTMVLSNWAASSYNAMLPSTGRDFWLTYMYNYAQPATSVELQLYAIAEDATTITVTAADGTVLVAGQPIAAGAAFTYTIPSDKAAKVYNTGTDITELKGLHVTSTSADIALYMRNGYSDGDLSYDISPVYATSALGKEYMVQTYTRDMDRTEMAIVAIEDGTQVTIVTGNEAQKNNGTTYSAGQTINLAMNAGQVYQIKGVAGKTGTLAGTTVQANKKVAVFNGGSKATIPYNTGANGDHLCEQSSPIEAWGKRFVLQEMNGFPGLEEEDVSSSPTEYYITAVYDNTEVKINGATKTTLQKGESYKVTVKYTEFPKLAETSMPVICYGYMTNGATNNYDEKTYGEPSMVLIPATDKGVNKVTLYAPKFDDPSATNIMHYANVTVPSTGTSTMMLNGVNVGSQFTTISGGLAYARLTLADGVNVLSNTECRFVAVAYDIEPELAISEAYATVLNLSSAAPKVYIGDELVDDGYSVEYCNKHPGIPFHAEVDYPHDSIKWVFGDGETHVQENTGDYYDDSHIYELSVGASSETNHIKFYVFHHTPLANEKMIDSVQVDLTVYPAYYIYTRDTVCGSEKTYTWTLPDGTTRTYNFDRKDDRIITDEIKGQTVHGCDSNYYLVLTVKPETTKDFTATVCQNKTYDFFGNVIDASTLDVRSTPYDYYDTLFGQNQWGCDSIRHLKLTVLRSDSTEFDATDCGSYEWEGDTYTTSGNYTKTLTNSVGCDSVVTLKLTIYPNYNETIPETACETYTWDGTTYTTSGYYTKHYTSQHGCDSTVTLNLTIQTPHTEPTVASICQGEQYVWTYNPEGKYNGQTFETNQTLADTVACGEIYTLSLTVLPRPSVTSISIQGGIDQCFEQSTTLNYQVSSNAVTYEYAIYGNGTIIDPDDPDDPSDLPPHPAPHRAGALINQTGTIEGNSLVMNTASLSAGIYEVRFVVKSADNCVSDTAKVSFRILEVKTSVVSDTICHDGSLLWFGTHYNTAGTFHHTGYYSNGCDSIRYTLKLIRLDMIEAEKDVHSVCKESLPFSWRGHEYYTSGTYNDTIYYQNGCDSVRFTLDLQIQEIDTIQPPLSATVCKGEFYKWDGGDIDTDTLTVGTHHFYSPVATAVGECLREVKHLVLTVQALPTPTEKPASACKSYTWNGTTYTESGDYTYTHKVGSCDVTDILHLTIGEPWETTVTKTIHPQNTPFTWSEFEVTFPNVKTPGTYTKDKFYKTVGTKCDSIYHLTLIVTDKIDSTLLDTICQGETYSWRGNSYNTTGIYTDDTNPDTIFNLDLLVQKAVTKTEKKHVCDATSFTWDKNGETYTTNGTYTAKKFYTTGCDSIVYTLNLSFGTPNTGEDHEIVCAGKYYTYNNTTITTEYGHDFTYEKTLTNASGCDSVVTVYVHVARSNKSEFPAEACGQYTWEGQTYTTSGDYEYTYTNAEGCDSVVTMHLTVHNVLNERIEKEMNEGEKFEWHRGLNGDTTIITAGTYYDHNTSVNGCDSTYILHVQFIKAQRDTITRAECDSFEWGGHTYTEGGIYGDTVWASDHKSYTAIHYVKLTINKSERHGYAAQTICEGDAVEMNGQTYHPTTTGWLRIESTTDKGCLRIDSMYVTVKTVEKKPADNIEVCENELPYTWHDRNYNTAGTYSDTLRYSNGCDSIIYTLKLTVNTITPNQEYDHTSCQLTTYHWAEAQWDINCRDYEPGTYVLYKDTIYPGECGESQLKLNLTIQSADPTVVYDTICHGDSYDWYIDGQLRIANLTSTCIQYDTIHNDECDLIYRLELEVRDPVETHVDDTVYLCAMDEPIQWHGMTLSESDTYIFRKEKVAQDGHCDSIYQITVVRTALEQKDYTDHACEGDDYNWNGQIIPAQDLQLGINHFYDTVPPVAPAVCPTVVNHLALTVTSPQTSEEDVIACEEYTWHGRHYTASTSDTIIVPATENTCSSTYILHLTIGHNIEQSDAIYVTEDQLPYTWHSSTFTATGQKDEHYRTVSGCDSIWHLTLTVTERIPDTTRATICQGETYKWTYDNIVYNETGIYSCTTSDKQPHLLYLTVNPAYAKDVYETTCDASYTWHGTEYTASGDYTWTGKTTLDCDSTETLHLTMLDNTAHNETRTVCPGELVRWGNESYTAVAGETKVLTRTNQCGIDETLTVTVRAAVTGEQTESACTSFEWHGTTYTESGNYTWTGATTEGCDSVVTLHLTINSSFNNDEDVEIHEDALPYHWTGHKGDTAIYDNGDYYDRFTTTAGCDSIYHLHLHIGFVARDTVSATDCDEYTWRGHTFTTGGLHTDTVWDGAHTDYNAIHYLNLTLHESVHATEDARLYCEDEEFEWYGEIRSLSVGEHDLTYTTQTQQGCDSIVTMHVTIRSKQGQAETATVCWTELPYIWQGKSLQTAGTYFDTLRSTVTGCDSIISMTLTVNLPQVPAVVEEQTICINNEYQWHNMTIQKSDTGHNTYYYRYLNPGDCDSITDQLNLTVQEILADTLPYTVCFNGSFDWRIAEENDTLVSHMEHVITDVEQSITIEHPLCNHTYVLQLKVLPASTSTDTTVTICEGDTYTWPVTGQAYSEAKIYSDTLRATTGCDSIIRNLDLRVIHATHKDTTITLCEGSSYSFYGEEFTNLTAGTEKHLEHKESYTNGCGCDSLIVTVDLTVVEMEEQPMTVAECGEYTWNEVTPARTFTNNTGATMTIDSTVIEQAVGDQCPVKHTLHLTLYPNYEVHEATTVASFPAFYKGIRFDGPATDSLFELHAAHADAICDSLVYITIDLKKHFEKTTTETICEGDTLTWKGKKYWEEGSYLNNTASEDTTYYLELTVIPTKTNSESITTCDNPYIWKGKTLTASGIYRDTVPGVGDACREINVLALNIVPTDPVSDEITICSSELPFVWGNYGSYSIAGTDTLLKHTRTLSCGIDVEDEILVHVKASRSSEEYIETCSNQPITWNGQTYAQSGDYTWTGQTAQGCDSVVTLHLTVKQADEFLDDIESVSIPYIWRGHSIDTDTLLSETFTKENGCDSTYTLHFHVNIADRINDQKESCGSYVWSQTGEEFTESTVARDTVWNGDHTNYTIYTLDLTIWPKYDYTSEEDMTVLKGKLPYLWHGYSLTETCDTTYMITTVHGCDSVLATLHLKVSDPIIVNLDTAVCENEGFHFKGQTYTQPTILSDTVMTAEGRDSITIITLTVWPTVRNEQTVTECESYEWNGQVLTESGDYELRLQTVEHGCDSMDVLHLTIKEKIVMKKMLVDEFGFCPGDKAYAKFQLDQGDATEYKLVFSQDAKDYGFKDIDYTMVQGTNDIEIEIPEGCPAGAYEASIQLTDEVCESESIKFLFYVAYDDVLRVMWNDVLAVDNSQKMFYAYEWYKNDQLLPGVTKQYYNAGEPLDGVYRARMQLRDGSWVYSCPLDTTIVVQTPLRLEAWPCPAEKGQPVTLTIWGADNETLANGNLRVYSASGQLVYNSNGPKRQQNVSFICGEYIGIFQTNDDRSVNVKFLVY